MQSLKELGDAITQQLENGDHLVNLSYILESYKAKDWQNYVKFCDIRYLKTLVYTNAYIDIFIICWNTNQSSGLHDHPENGCLMRILDGKLQEDVYIKENNKYEFSHSSTLDIDEIAYKIGNQHAHNIINLADKTVSLHIYSPSGYKTNYIKLPACSDH